MEIEYDVRVIPVDGSFQAEVEKLAVEGWQLVPGTKPQAFYSVMREKRQEFKLVIDDSKIHILRNGQSVE